MKYLFIFLSYILISGCSGSYQDNIRVLHGTWIPVLRSDVIYLGGEKNHFDFKNDSFKVKIENWTDAINEWDPCSNGHWFEFAKGKFHFDDDTIYFVGLYTDSVYTEIKKGCYNTGLYKKSYEYEIFKDSAYFKNSAGEIILLRKK